MNTKLSPLYAGILLAFAPAAWSGVTTEYLQASNQINNDNDVSYFVAPTSVSNDGNLIAFVSEDTSNAPSAIGYGLYNRTTGQVNTPIQSIDGTAVKVGSPTISGNGRYLAFYSGTDNLIANDPVGKDLFVHDLQTGNVEQVSLMGSFQLNVNGNMGSISMSDTGRFIAFPMRMQNSDGTSYNHAVVRDIELDQARLYGNGTPTISGDGTVVATYRSGERTITILDRASHTAIEQITLQTLPSDASIARVTLSFDGRYVAFNTQNRLYLYDRNSGETREIVKRNPNGDRVAGVELVTGHFSDDGRFLAVQQIDNSGIASAATSHNALVYNLASGKLAQVSDNTQPRTDTLLYHRLVPRIYQGPMPISADGSVIAMDMLAELAAEDTNNNEDIYIFEVEAPATINDGQAINVTETGFTASWTALSDSQIETRYELQRLDAQALKWTEAVSTNDTSYSFTGLEAGSEHLVRIRAVNDWKSGDYSYIYTQLK